MKLEYLEDKWDDEYVQDLDQPEILRYRSNLLGSDLRITNFGGGNTSSKVMQRDPVTDEEVEVLWVKGSGGDLGSIKRDGFARLYMDKFRALRDRYRGREYEDEMVDYYPLCRFGLNDRPASIDTPIHGLTPYKHVDHTHPDWAIALAASANGKRMLQEFNDRFGFNLIWLPWERPGYHLATMLEDALNKNPDAEGVIMASHGLHTWGDEQYACYRRTIEIIDAMGQFINEKMEEKGDDLFSGQKFDSRDDREDIAAAVFPFVRGRVGSENMVIGEFVDLPDVLRFVNSEDAEALAFQGTSCPDHFIRTKVRPFYVNWNPETGDIDSLKSAIESGLKQYRVDYKTYYEENKEPDSPAMRDSNPRVVLIPGIGMLAFGKNKKEARVTGEFYVNAIHVMEGATSLDDGKIDEDINEDQVLNNYVALTPREAFRIEYWALEEAKLKRQPPEQELARQVLLVVGAGSGIGRDSCDQLVEEGGHLMVADLDGDLAKATHQQMENTHGKELSDSAQIDITDRVSVRSALRKTVLQFGGVDILINTAAMIAYPDENGDFADELWDKTLRTNVTGNYILTDEFNSIVKEQGTEGVILLTSSANAVVPKTGSEPYDVSKTAVNHLIRELAIRYAPNIRVNGVSPARVVDGSSMFPRERVISSLKKYNVRFDPDDSTESLINKLSEYYAESTLTHAPMRPQDVSEAIYYLVSSKSSRTTGHIIPVDGGLTDAFLR
ncbi:MAG: bifunctional rhamnulose-1-phosphate aldolase/short-chain dehydrogenase [Candidatus Marinimicrobia bacterium]|nr:bifunctional rhamnulose-1-phosphate aldolase/short-chain dehydrogenase [Candidatus Neomarinimicrobiota bacterium]MCF7828311.1 bifunctional rhamnulose-1-phosphate aldolase/short-chain dehydrogenase [Candidatus Neomarinimicrobiota bacterium]MCF7879514.1 bifunctional rhamnulose-1-phosphate aldolase/short-chain dehydrogenase [Candidatus Neomarinimicrobiota bacterium]